MNQLNTLHGDNPNDTPRGWNIQPLTVYLTFRNYPPNNSPVFLAIMGILNNHVVDNGDVEVYPSEYPFLSNSDSVPYPDTTPIKSIDDNEM